MIKQVFLARKSVLSQEGERHLVLFVYALETRKGKNKSIKIPV